MKKYSMLILVVALVNLCACNLPTGQTGGQNVSSEENDSVLVEPAPRPDAPAAMEEPPAVQPEEPTVSVAEIIPYEVGEMLDLSPQAQLDYQAEWERFNEISAAMRTGQKFSDLSAADQAFVQGFDEERPASIFFVGPGSPWYEGGGPYKLDASSVLAPAPPNNYYVENAHDFDLSTAWVEGKEDDGIGESISYFFKANSPPVTEVLIYNGYLKNASAWENNNRVKALKMYVDDEFVAILKLSDTSGLQKFQLGQEYQSNTGDMEIRFEIMAVYKGNKYSDTAITEIEFDGTGVN
jgi:hypothetical protein